MSCLNAVALIPYYDSNGYNCTRLIFADGTEQLETTPINQLIEEMHIPFRLDYNTNMRWASSYLLGKGNAPILLDKNHVFIKCKTRHGAAKRHGCYGYVSLFAIENIKASTLYLNNNIKVPTCSSINQLTKSFQQATLLYSVYLATKDPSPLLPSHTDHLLRNLSKNFNKKSQVRLTSTTKKKS